MAPDRELPKLPRWIWFAAAAILAAIPIAVSVGVPAPRPGAAGAAHTADAKPAGPPADSPAAVPTIAAADSSSEIARPGDSPAAGDPDLGVTTPRTPYDVAYDALESEMAPLKIEKQAIEAEEARLRGKREELEAFERDHPDGAPKELYSRYEDDLAAYNSDVQAFKSRAGAYQMKVADIERRVEALRGDAP
jgi:hypothetical protein